MTPLLRTGPQARMPWPYPGRRRAGLNPTGRPDRPGVRLLPLAPDGPDLQDLPDLPGTDRDA